MGGGSGSNANSASNTVYTQTTTKNPYVQSTTNNFGTTTTLNDGTAYKSIYDYTNKNIDELLEEYRHPTINTATSRHYNIDDYPAVKEYLLTFDKRVLEQSGEKDIDGIKGKNARKKTCNKWFETQDSIAYWDDFSKQKIVYSEIVQSPQFYLDNGEFYIEATSFLLTGNNLEYLIACLNSKPISYFFKTFYAGGGLGEKGYRYKKAFLINLPIPLLKNIDYKLDTFKTLIKNNDTKEIDNIIYKIYQLSDSEIEYIEKLI